ncbi:MAG: NAD(P)/FAD-dependent oxidoreductase [Pedobacter sp.]|nr:NAD(P)/FAD-dependent oxidoreductase [Pedobacter sp.]
MLKKKVVIVGGGLAGLTCAIHLLKSGIPVTLIEKSNYPNHKVCGEFISNEIRSYWASIGIDINSLEPAEISRFSISSSTGQSVSSLLPLGGFGISRFTLDHFLFQKVVGMGCQIIKDTADNIEFYADKFYIQTHKNGVILADLVIGAFGKRSSLDQKLGRRFFAKKSQWLAVKAHYRGDFESNKVALHNFEGGYCGISKVEKDVINVCYLTGYAHFKAFKNIEEFQEKVLRKNPFLKNFFDSSEMIFDHPITISQISFGKKLPVERHILMIGDTAGLIHPLCGNGMAMAIHSAKLCAELVDNYLHNKIKNRLELERAYSSIWKSTFQKRLLMGRLLASILKKGNILNVLLHLLVKFPSLLPRIIKRTHGKPHI